MEVAFTLLIFSLVSWSAFAAYDSLRDAQERRAAKGVAQHLQQTLRSFALRHGRLPCPDTSATGTGYENLAAGVCASGSQLGWFPYASTGLDLPIEAFRARYAVYRQANAVAEMDADLAVSKERSGDEPGQLSYQDAGDLIVALNAARDQAPSADRSHLTGDGGVSGVPDCSSNLSQAAAYWVVIPLNDRSLDGDRLDPPNTFNGLCAGGTLAPVSAAYDDVVVAESPGLLAGWLRQNLP